MGKIPQCEVSDYTVDTLMTCKSGAFSENNRDNVVTTAAGEGIRWHFLLSLQSNGRVSETAGGSRNLMLR